MNNDRDPQPNAAFAANAEHPDESIHSSMLEAVGNLIKRENSDNPTPVTAIVTVESVRDLLVGLGNGDVTLVQQALLELGANHDGTLYKQVGEMTRSLHNSLREFQRSLDAASVTMHSTNMPDAANKIEAVIEMTFNAANDTLSAVERQTDLLAEAEAARTQAIEMLSHGELSNEVLRAQFLEYIEKEKDRTEEMATLNGKIMVAQEFQDLCGQALKKVLKLVTELEANLVELVRIFGIAAVTGEPVTQLEEKPPAEKIGQDEVDSLLSSFGF